MTEYLNDDYNDDAETHTWYADLVPSFRPLPKLSLPPGVARGFKYTTFTMDPTILLPYLQNAILATGRATFLRATVRSIPEARRRANADIVVNASGLGARELVPDVDAYGVRGQTMLVRGLGLEECIMREGRYEYTYVIPRGQGGDVILGGWRSEVERKDAVPDEDVRRDIVERVRRILGENAVEGVDLGDVDVERRGWKDIVGFRPARNGGVRVERWGDVVHAYGAGGAGYIYSFGVAERVCELIEGSEGRSKL